MYLLSTQIYLDLIEGVDENSSEKAISSQKWFDTVPNRTSVMVSSVSFGQALSIIEGVSLIQNRRHLRRRLSELQKSIFQPLDVCVKTAEHWSALDSTFIPTIDRPFNEDRILPMTAVRKFVVATAIANDLTLIENFQPYHALLAKTHGLTVTDPYDDYGNE